MPIKVAKATKDLAYQKLRDGLSNKEVAELTGLSMRSIGRMKSVLDGKSAMPARNARIAQEVGATAGDEPHTGTTILDFEESPAPVEKKSVVDSALDSLKSMLGITDKPAEKKNAAPVAAKLDAKRQQFVDAVAPTAALAAMGIAAWMWSRIDNDLKFLAPDEATAQRIMEPLLRVYARHANFLADINPDVADIGASLLALGGYVRVSLALYREIKERDYEDFEEETGFRRGRFATAASTQPEDGAGDESSGSTPVRRQYRQSNKSSGGTSGNGRGVDRVALSDKEAAQYAALSRLSMLDYQHRARRANLA
jgi:hypothetical protein